MIEVVRFKVTIKATIRKVRQKLFDHLIIRISINVSKFVAFKFPVFTIIGVGNIKAI
jgi:hypothetical protein